MGDEAGPEGRLRDLVEQRLEPGERVLAWGRAWVSRDRRHLHTLLAARTHDHVVVTDRRLMLFAAGFFTGHARRRVLADRLATLSVDPLGAPRHGRLRVRAPGHRPLRLELGGDTAGRELALMLREAAAHAAAAEVEVETHRSTAAPMGGAAAAGAPAPDASAPLLEDPGARWPA